MNLQNTVEIRFQSNYIQMIYAMYVKHTHVGMFSCLAYEILMFSKFLNISTAFVHLHFFSLQLLQTCKSS